MTFEIPRLKWLWFGFNNWWGRNAAYLFIRIFWKAVITGRQHLPRTGAGILVSNHISHFDPPLMGARCGRPVDFVTSLEFFGNPVMRAFFLSVGCVPLNRFGVDRKAIRHCLDRLKNGRLLGLYPEGGLRSGERSVLNGAPITEGAATLALLSGAPIHPCVILGSDRLYDPKSWFQGRRLWIRYGPPLHVTKGMDRSRLNAQIAQSLRDLYQEMITDYRLTPADLPQTAQHRKGRE
ncbi:MAG: lysophospholipid acyltransferase family protein [Verrucomicrobiae bacterium]|nr:lysophospholipid acyltransferase family protein [Verrucomicrobiae bacterium]